MNRASSATGWVRNPIMKSPELDPTQASSYELGWTFNPITGCLNGCPYCYARKLANGRLRSRYLANKNVAPISKQEGGRTFRMGIGLKKGYRHVTLEEVQADPFYPRFWEDRLYHSWGGEPKGVFVCDMSDLFGIGIPKEWTDKVLNLCRLHEQNRYYLLTKQPQELPKWSPFPSNCYVGVSVTKPEFLLPALDAIDSIQCSVRYLSIEPMLASFDVPDLSLLLEGSVDWLILGSQTRPNVMPKIEWVEEIVRACDKAGIPVFLKDNLMPLMLTDLFNVHKWSFKDHQLRQEMPKSA